MKVDQKTGSDVAQLHVGEQLCFVNRQQLVDRLQFDQYFVFNDQVHPVADFESYTSVRHWQIDLPVESNRSQRKLPA